MFFEEMAETKSETSHFSDTNYNASIVGVLTYSRVEGYFTFEPNRVEFD